MKWLILSDVHSQLWQCWMEKANACFLDLHCDTRVWDWDVHFLWKNPSYSWNIQTVWQCSIQFEPPSSPYTWINYQLEPFAHDWQTCTKKDKNVSCQIDKDLSVTTEAFWSGFLKGFYPPSPNPLPLLLEICHAFGLRGNKRVRLHFYCCGLAKNKAAGEMWDGSKRNIWTAC